MIVKLTGRHTFCYQVQLFHADDGGKVPVSKPTHGTVHIYKKAADSRQGKMWQHWMMLFPDTGRDGQRAGKLILA